MDHAYCKQDLFYVFPEMKLHGLVSNFHIHVSLSDLYISRSVHLFYCNQIGKPIVGIYQSLTDTWMWELGTRPRSFIYGNVCFEFATQWFCSILFNSIVFLFHYISIPFYFIPFHSILFYSMRSWNNVGVSYSSI